MAKPITVLTFADDATYPAGAEPEAGTATKTDPAREAFGWRPNEKPTARNMNWVINLIALWIQWLNGIFGTDGSLTLDNNANVKISGTGIYKHGTRTLQIPALDGTPGDSTAVWGSPAGVGVIDVDSPFTWQFPIKLDIGKRITAIRALFRDSVTGPTTMWVVPHRMNFVSGGTNQGWATSSVTDFTAVAGTDVITNTAGSHNGNTGAGPFQLTSSGTLPGGLALATDYWMIRISSTTYKLASSYRNAIAGTPIDIIDAGTGTHTATSQEGFSTSAASNGDGTDKTISLAGSKRIISGSNLTVKIERASGSAVVRIYGIEVDYDELD